MVDTILILAIFLQLISTSINYIGMTIQKKATGNMPKIGVEASFLKSIKNMLKSKGWIFGQVLNASSAFFAAGAFALASITIIQPLYGFGLIVLVIFTHFYLKEKITFLDIFGVSFTIAGVILLGINAKSLPEIPYLDLLEKFTNLRGILFFASFLGLALITYIISEKTKKTTSIVLLVISSALWTSTQNIFNKAVATAIRDVGFVEAFFGSAWLYCWTFVFLFLFVSIIGLIMLNIAYQVGLSVIILPIYTAIQVVIPVLSGIIVFEEWATGFTGTDIAIQSLGIFVMLISIVILSISNGHKEDLKKRRLEGNKYKNNSKMNDKQLSENNNK